MSLKPFSACVVPERTASVAADAVRGRIDWKYLLCLELDDPGFDHSVLCEFRARLLEGGAERILFDDQQSDRRQPLPFAYAVSPREIDTATPTGVNSPRLSALLFCSLGFLSGARMTADNYRRISASACFRLFRRSSQKWKYVAVNREIAVRRTFF